MTNFRPLKLQIDPKLLQPQLGSYLQKTVLPLSVEVKTILDLLKNLFKQFKPMMKEQVDCGKLYLTTIDDYFLPPNCNIQELGIFEMKLATSQRFEGHTEFLFQVRKREQKAAAKLSETKLAEPVKNVEVKPVIEQPQKQLANQQPTKKVVFNIPKKVIESSSSSESQSEESGEIPSSSSEQQSSESDKIQKTQTVLTPFDRFVQQNNIDKPYLDKFSHLERGPAPKFVPQTVVNREYFTLMNNQNMTVILLKSNYFSLNNRKQDLSKLTGRIVIFSLNELDTKLMTPVVSPLRVGVLLENGNIKLRHDFMHTKEEAAEMEQCMQGIYSNGIYTLPTSEFIEIWVRKEGLQKETIDFFTQFDQNQTLIQPKTSNKDQFAAIRRQIEYYFSDKSYSKDKFLLSQKDQDGYISLNVFMSFNKMKQIGSDLQTVIDALSDKPLQNAEFDVDRQMLRKK